MRDNIHRRIKLWAMSPLTPSMSGRVLVYMYNNSITRAYSVDIIDGVYRIMSGMNANVREERRSRARSHKEANVGGFIIANDTLLNLITKNTYDLNSLERILIVEFLRKASWYGNFDKVLNDARERKERKEEKRQQAKQSMAEKDPNMVKS